MKKIFTALCAVCALTASADPVPATISEMINENASLAQGEVSADSYYVCTKNANTGAVVNKIVTVLAAGPDKMFVKDAQNNVIGVEHSEGMPAFNTYYVPGNSVEEFTVRYKANYVTRDGEQTAVPYSVYDAEEYTKRATNLSVSYTPFQPYTVANVKYAFVSIGKGGSMSTTSQNAEWVAADGVFKFNVEYGGRTYKARVLAQEMGIDCSGFKEGSFDIYAEGVLEPTADGFDLYPAQVLQYAPVDLTSIAEAIEASKSINNTTSENFFNLTSHLHITAISNAMMFIEDSTGAMLVKTENANKYDLTSSGLKAGDYIDRISFKIYHTSQYGEAMNGVYCSETMPEATGFEAVEFPLVTLATLQTDYAAYDCRPVKLEDVRVLSNGMYEGISINPSNFMTGFAFDNRKFYTIEGIYQNQGSGSISVTSATETGDVPAMVPVDVANIEEFIEKALELQVGGTSEDIYRITGKVGVVNKGSYMFIQDATGALQVNGTGTTISNAPYSIGNVVGGLVLKAKNEKAVAQGYFDNDECTWPEACAGESILPEQVALDDVDESYEFRWISLGEVTATNPATISLPGIHTSSQPNNAATITVNNSLGSSAISMTKNSKYDIVGVLVATHNYTATAGSTITRWQLYASSYKLSESSVVEDAANVGELLSKNADLQVGETSQYPYELGPVYVTVRTDDKIFIQTGTDGIVIESSEPGASLFGFNYKYADVVNGLKGKVKNDDGILVLLVSPTSYPVSTMNMPIMVQTQEATVADLETKRFVMLSLIEAEVKEDQETRSSSLKLGYLNIVDSGVLNAETGSDPVDYPGIYNLKGVSDGENFYVYSAEVESLSGIEAIDAESQEISEIYTLSGVRVAAPSAGIYIIRLKDGRTIKKTIK